MGIGRKLKYTTEEYIQKVSKIHNNKYDYSLSVYKGMEYEVVIICPEHGEFKQAARSHINGNGCPRCWGRNKTTEEYIEEVKVVHNNYYDYSQTIYTGSNNKIIVNCPEHGKFEPKAADHLMGRKCPRCTNRSYKYTQEEYVQMVGEIHNYKYDYSETIYIDNTKEIIIICPIHGRFKQVAQDHRRGAGCRKCVGKDFEYLSYEECKKILKPIMQSLTLSLGRLVTSNDYIKWWNANKRWCQETGIPRTPHQYYGKYGNK